MRDALMHTLCRPMLFLYAAILNLLSPANCHESRQTKRQRQRQRQRLMPLIERPNNVLGMFALMTSKAIKEKIGQLTDRVQAIVDLANDENRDPTKEEQAEIDAILGVGKSGTDGYKPGKIDALERQLEQAEKLEARQAQLAASRSATPPQRSDGPHDAPPPAREQPRAASIQIPAAAAYRHGSLKAFHGPHAEQEAYLSGQWFLAAVLRNERAAQWCRDNGIEIRAALSEGADSLGGFLVPTEMESRIIDLRESYGVARRYAAIEPMGSDTKQVPRRASGLTAYFVGENSEITASDAGWDQVSLTARKLAALCKYSSELSEDAVIGIADKLAMEIAYAFAVKEDACLFLGDGSSTYGHMTGLISAIAAGSTVTAATGNTAFSTLDLTDFEAMVGKLPEYPGIQPRWFISKAGWAASMLRLLDAAGGNTSAQLTAGVPPSFLGFDVVLTQTMNSTLSAQTSTNGICYFGDLSMGVLMGSRRGIALAVSDQRYFEYDQLAIKGTERFDLNVHGTGTASAAGPVIMLATPSS